MTKKVSKKSVKRKYKSIRRQTRKVKSVKRNRRQYGGKLKRKSKKIKKIKIKQSGGTIDSDGDGFSFSDDSGSDDSGNDSDSSHDGPRGDLDKASKHGDTGEKNWGKLRGKLKLARFAKGFGFNLAQAMEDFTAHKEILEDIKENIEGKETVTKPEPEIPKDSAIDYEREDASKQLRILREIYEKYSGIKSRNRRAIISKSSKDFLKEEYGGSPDVKQEFNEDKDKFVKTCNYIQGKIKKNRYYGAFDLIRTKLNAYCSDRQEYLDIKKSPGCMREIYLALRESRQ